MEICKDYLTTEKKNCIRMYDTMIVFQFLMIVQLVVDDELINCDEEVKMYS